MAALRDAYGANVSDQINFSKFTSKTPKAPNING